MTADATDAAFLAAIRASPADDLRRLVYADRLEETGRGDRAEFVRLQCELDALGPCRCGESGPAGCARCREGRGRGLWDALGRLRLKTAPDWPPVRWTAEVVPGEWSHADGEWWWSLTLWGKPPTESVLSAVEWLRAPVGRCEWERGFIEGLELPSAVAVPHLDRVLAAHPVRRVRLTTEPEVTCRWRGLETTPGVCWLRHDAPRFRRFPYEDVWREASACGEPDAGGVVRATDRNLALALLRLRWPAAEYPGLAFELPTAWYVLPAVELRAGAEVNAGDLVGYGPDGRVVPFPRRTTDPPR